MKKSIISVFVIAAAAIAFVSCDKEVAQTGEAPVQKTSKVSFVASQPDTKAAFGTQSGTTLPTLWTSNDTRAVTILNCTSAAFTTITPSSDGKTAYFDTAISDDETGSYSFSLLSPLSAFYGYTDSLKLTDGSYIPIVAYEIPSVQTSGADTPDEDAMVLLAATDKLSAWPTEQLDVTFHHLTAYLKLDLQNLDLDEGENVETVVITSESNLAGVLVVNADNGYSDFYDGSTSIVVNTSGNNPVWVACAPLDEGTVLTITAKTDAKYEYEVEYTTPADLPAGTVAEVTVDYDGVMGNEVLFSYEDWLGTFNVNEVLNHWVLGSDGYVTVESTEDVTGTWTIEQNVQGESYTITGIEELNIPVTAEYDVTTGSLVLKSSLNLFTDEDGDVWGILGVTSKYLATGTLFTANWDNVAKTSATVTPGSYGGEDFNVFQFYYTSDNWQQNYRTYIYYADEAHSDIISYETPLPNKMTKISTSAAASAKPSQLSIMQKSKLLTIESKLLAK
ncbi:MAG: hypothetical protein K6C31_05495 [Bacteroidales bacterium]|nr:hypothetical protein [Bacteroidales bacterium]